MRFKHFFVGVLAAVFLSAGLNIAFAATSEIPESIQQNNAFRQDVMKFVHQIATHYVNHQEIQPDTSIDQHWFNGGHPVINWAMEVSVYEQGELVGRAQTDAKSLTTGLIKAANMAFGQAHLDKKSLETARIKVTFYYPPDSRQYSIIDDKDGAAELVGNIVPVRIMDTDLVKSRILAEKAYLLRMMDPDLHAFFKRYDSKRDRKEITVRTIYTSSSLFTLLKINSVFPDPVIENQIIPMANFILSMQEHTGKNAGAFHYSYNKKTHKKDNRFVVGTASKTIFTLLLLNDRTHDPKYLNAAKEAGNWLMTKVDSQGRVNPVLTYRNKKWNQITKQSFLYSGQVLSALSRLYHTTQDRAYYDKATLIANRFVEYVKKNGPFVGDDFRTPNSVSTSWMVMSLLDYAKINPAPIYQNTITRCASELLARQANDPYDVFNDGRVVDLISASGNGWVNEVMTVLYPFCRQSHMPNCGSYRHFILNSSRWLMQNVYTSTNSFAIKDPAVANGGAIPNFLGVNVRTDAVCHGGNSLVGFYEIAGPQNKAYMVLPEKSLDEVLGLLGIGRLPETCAVVAQ